MAGYSGTPLPKKLGVKSGMRAALIGAPDWLGPVLRDAEPAELVELRDAAAIPKELNFIHFFSSSSATLEAALPKLRQSIAEDGMIWISWPKKAAKVETDVTGDVVRRLGLAGGLVDIKVCAVDDIWSGLKFVIPVKVRTAGRKRK